MNLYLAHWWTEYDETYEPVTQMEGHLGVFSSTQKAALACDAFLLNNSEHGATYYKVTLDEAIE